MAVTESRSDIASRALPIERGVSEKIAEGLAAFRRDLPRLLADHYMDWVAYSGHRRIGIARTQTELAQRCLDEGLRQHEFVVCSIEPPKVTAEEEPIDTSIQF